MACKAATLAGASAARTTLGRGRGGAIDPARAGARPLVAAADESADVAAGSNSGLMFSDDLERGAGREAGG